jgi:hypothetical protein
MPLVILQYLYSLQIKGGSKKLLIHNSISNNLKKHLISFYGNFAQFEMKVRGVLLSTLLLAILHPSHHLLNVLLQIANKLGLSNKQNIASLFVFTALYVI